MFESSRAHWESPAICGVFCCSARHVRRVCPDPVATFCKKWQQLWEGSSTVARREYPGVYPYALGDGRTLYRAVFRDSAGRLRQKRGFTSPTAASKHRAKMGERADRGELRMTREAFGEHFDQWLRGHHSIGKGSRADYRGHGERRLKPYFGTMRLSAIGVQTVRDFVSEMVEQVEAGSLAPKTVNNALSCLSTCLKDAVALGKIPSNPCDHVAHLPDRHIERDRLADQRGARAALGRCRLRKQGDPRVPPAHRRRRR